MVELTDVVFAMDGVPAIFAITSDPFIVYTSNIFAALGCARCTARWPPWSSASAT